MEGLTLDFDDLDLDGVIDDSEATIETTVAIEPRLLKRQAKARVLSAMKREHLRDVMPEPPEPGYSYHVISNGKFDYWTWIPAMIEWVGRADELYVSTWTLNRNNCADLFRLMDEGKIGRTGFLTGLYFKRRESAVYATLLHGLQRRGHRYACLANHAKVALIHNEAADAWIVVEGSANLTANPRIEQYVITDDRTVYQFHKGWMEQCLSAGQDGPDAAS